jgi:hypothetical protein
MEDYSVTIRPLLVLFATLSLASPLAAADCPVERSGDAISGAIEKAPSCDAAMKVFEACAYVANIDVQFGATVREKCEAGFLSKLSAARRKTYNREHEACERKYIKQEGSMYRSFEAFCHAKLARAYARRMARP